MEQQVVRVLTLGTGEMLDRVAACLTGEGYAVAQVDDRQHARRLLKAGGFDIVLADGESRALPEMLTATGSERPWILLGRADGPLATPDHALWLDPAVSKDELCGQIEAMIRRAAEARQAHEKQAQEKQAQAKKPREKAATAGRSRPAT
jgi:DNA-binding NtrC family response regulator